jgi:hypothetical protein
MSWGNLLIAFLLLPLTLFVFLKFVPLAARLTNQTEVAETHFEKITDAAKLRETLLNEIRFKQVFWNDSMHLAGALSFLGASLILCLLLNAFYLSKAHRILKTRQANP